MQSLLTEPFDRFGRYAHLWRLRQAFPLDRRLRVLDVGDPYGVIGVMLADDVTVNVDLYAEPYNSGPDHSRMLGSGFDLPFPDNAFDIVASHDTFEHLDDAMRPRFVQELLRVSSGPVLLVAPFADPRTKRCEDLVNSFFVARFGHTLDPLDEHAENGLPRLESLTDHLDTTGVPYAATGEGWLYHWLPMMLLKGHLASEELGAAELRIDTTFNNELRERDGTPPHYRRAIVMRPPDGFDIGPPVAPPGDVDGDLARLTAIGIDMVKALPRGVDPIAADSPLRAWIDEQRSGPDPLPLLADSMSRVLDAARPEPAPVEVEPDAPRLRSVAVIIINFNGAEHMPTCLDSLAALDYPKELLEVVVVDNGSTDGSLELLARDYPWVRVLAQPANVGFAPAVNIGAAAVDTECLVMLNNDMRVDPDWLTCLMGSFDPEHGVVCVGSQILSWDGESLDFGDAAMSFYGMGYQIGFGRGVESVDVEDRELLFACGGSMLVDRQVYRDTGGFDDKFFAYFEDVDFGWRLWVLGYRVVLASGARCFHRLHGTSSRFGEHERMLLYERNALRSIIKNYDDENLQAVLGPALLLLIKRAVIRGGLEREPYDIGQGASATEEVSRLALSHLHAVVDIVDDMEALLKARHQVQSARKRPDEQVVERFGRPLLPVIPDDSYLDTQQRIVGGFGLDKRFERRRAAGLLIVSTEPLGEKMRGPAIRAWEIARALARTVDVTVAVPPGGKPSEDVHTEVYEDESALRRLADGADAVLVQGYTVHRFPKLADTPALLVVDLYDPWLFENLEIHSENPRADESLHIDAGVLNQLLDVGDFFICASERQRDYWLGMLSARGRLDAATYSDDPSLRRLIDVVPFGLPDRPPHRLQPVLKGVHPQVAEDDLVVLWGGGAWDWFDPLTTIEAFKVVVDHVPNAKLYFLGLQLASKDVQPMRMASMAVQRAEELGLAGKSVLFGDWAPYELREAYLLEADVGVSAARDLAETRLAFRSRILDYLWAGLPVVSTSGDVLSDLVHEQQLGLVVPPGDPGQLAHALIRLLGNPVLRAESAARARAVSQQFRWTATVEPLRRLAAAPWQWRRARTGGSTVRPLADDGQQLLAHWRNAAAAEMAHLRSYIHDLEQTVEHQNRRLAPLRNSPAYPMFRAAKRLVRRPPPE